jgi:excisionase family DNA binding protein
MNTVLSTREVAVLLNVTETTVKRWSDEGRIPCIRTLGGHRKFELKEIINFAEINGYSLTGMLPPPMTFNQMEKLQFGVFSRNYSKVADVLLKEALESDREGVTELLFYLIKNNIPFYTIADEIIRPALEQVGELWEKGKISIHEEHLVSQELTEAMIRVAPELHRKHSNGLTAAFACLEGELHDIGLRCLAYTFESEGWKIYYIGANTPTDSILSFIKGLKPELFALSFTMMENREKIVKDFNNISDTIHAYGGKLIIGGSNIDNLSEKDLNCDHVVHSASDALKYARETFQHKRGPKLKA